MLRVGLQYTVVRVAAHYSREIGSSLATNTEICIELTAIEMHREGNVYFMHCILFYLIKPISR